MTASSISAMAALFCCTLISCSSPAVTKEFSCPGMEGFSFRYPEFKGWEIRGIEQNHENSCRMMLNTPDYLEFEIAPQIIVKKLPELGWNEIVKKMRGGLEPSVHIIDDSGMKLVAIKGMKQKNPQGALYDFTFDPSLYTKGYIPHRSEWNYLQFYSDGFGIRIIPFQHEEDGYSSKAFVKEVVNSFQWSPAVSAACGMGPRNWCPSPLGDPCGVHKEVKSCRADTRCQGMPYHGESVVPCVDDGSSFPSNCPTVGCISRCERLDETTCQQYSRPPWFLCMWKAARCTGYVGSHY